MFMRGRESEYTNFPRVCVCSWSVRAREPAEEIERERGKGSITRSPASEEPSAPVEERRRCCCAAAAPDAHSRSAFARPRGESGKPY